MHDVVDMETSTIHHSAFRLAEVVAICGADGPHTFESDDVTCAECRSICRLDVE